MIGHVESTYLQNNLQKEIRFKMLFEPTKKDLSHLYPWTRGL